MSQTSLKVPLLQTPPSVPLSVSLSAPVNSTASLPPKATLATASVLPLAIPAAFVTEILTPYRANAKYLKSAEITHVRTCAAGEETVGIVTGRGRFSIQESCYIDDTGHFNAVEFNICYNQLAYVVFGHCIASGILQQLTPSWDEKVQLSYADYKLHQLPSMLITKLEGRFSKQLKSDDFSGELTVNRISGAGRAYFCFTTIAFSNAEEVKSRGSVVLAFSPAGADTGA
jgi:hypothetical protein